MDGEDFTARNEYYRKARICPHCGNDDKVAESEHPFGDVRVRRYVCLKCGWHWEVEAYHEENESPSAAEDKIADRPQIQVGDVVRVSQYGATRCFVVWDVDIDGLYVDSGARVFSPEQIISIYRLGGRDFKLIWRDEEYYRRIWAETCATVSKAAKDFAEAMKSVTAALEKLAKAARDNARKATE